MPQLIQPNKVITREIVTKDGECTIHITLDLNINVNSSGVEVSVGKATQEKNDDDEVQWAVPQFTSGQKVKFGKKE
jgi:hypothetical protein